MLHVDHSELWKGLEQFEFDSGTPRFGFADRLARENGWTREETEVAIREYKRFVSRNDGRPPGDALGNGRPGLAPAPDLHRFLLEPAVSGRAGTTTASSPDAGRSRGANQVP